MTPASRSAKGADCPSIIIIMQRLTRHVSVIRLTNRRHGFEREYRVSSVNFSPSLPPCLDTVIFMDIPIQGKPDHSLALPMMISYKELRITIRHWLSLHVEYCSSVWNPYYRKD